MSFNDYNTKFLTWLIYFIPISLISGTLILNLNLVLITIILLIYLFNNKITFKYLKLDWFKIAIIFFFFQIFTSIVNGSHLNH